jgi:hypothetical protein
MTEAVIAETTHSIDADTLSIARKAQGESADAPDLLNAIDNEEVPSSFV